MKKRLISLALVLVLALSLLPISALAVSYDQFTDLDPDEWYAPYIQNALDKGYFLGVSDTEFAPNGTMTRAMFITVIARLAGVEQVASAESKFTDVETDYYYACNVDWAHENGIIFGYEDGTFRPYNNVTREEMAAIMTRYIAYEAGNYMYQPDGADPIEFTDEDAISNWAKQNVQDCVSYGLIIGFEDGSFRPQNGATRAEVSTVLQRLALFLSGDHIYQGVLGLTNTLKTYANKAAVKAEDLSAEYIAYVETLDEKVGDIEIADYIDTTLAVGELVDGKRVVTVDGKAYLNENTVANFVKVVASYALALYGEGNQVTYEGAKEIVDAIKEDVKALNLGYLTEMEAAQIAELAYSTVRGQAADLWNANFKGEKGYYTGDITVSVGNYTGTIVVDDETGVSIPNWKSEAKAFAIALAKEVGKSIVAQAQDYTSSIENIGAVIDIKFSAGAYAEDTDRYTYNYPVAVSLSFLNEFDTFQYKLNDGVYVKAYISERAQQGFKTAASTALDKIMESEAFLEKFNPAVEEVKDAQLAPVIDVLAKGELQDEETANKIVDDYINNWAKANAESKLTGDGQWDNQAIYDLATLVGMEVNSYVEKELDAKGLVMKEDITPAQLKDNMITAGVEFDVDPALENYVLAVICDQVSGEDKYAAEDSEYTAAMKDYVDETLPAAIEDNDNFNKALQLVEKVRNALESVDNLSAVKFGNITTLLRNETVQSYLTYEKPDNMVAKFAKYIEKIPAKATVVFAGCTLNEAAVIELKNAQSVAEVCDILADIIEETGLAELTLADFAPEAGQNLTVSYGEKSATLNIVVEFQK